MDKSSLQSIAVDLKRAAMGYHSGSVRMADVFLNEALRRIMNESKGLSNPLKMVFREIRKLQYESDIKRRAEYSLTFSTMLLSLAK
jgi:hypothetical protein